MYLEELQRRVLPHFGMLVCFRCPLLLMRIHSAASESGDRAQGRGCKGRVDVVGDTSSSNTCRDCLLVTTHKDKTHRYRHTVCAVPPLANNLTLL